MVMMTMRRAEMGLVPAIVAFVMSVGGGWVAGFRFVVGGKVRVGC